LQIRVLRLRRLLELFDPAGIGLAQRRQDLLWLDQRQQQRVTIFQI
jgi:hypothetical protein